MVHYDKIAEFARVSETQLNQRNDPFLTYLLEMVHQHCDSKMKHAENVPRPMLRARPVHRREDGLVAN